MSRRMLASCGLARSSSSPLGKIFFVKRAARFFNSCGNPATISNSVAHVSRSARMAPRASIARSHSRATPRIAIGSSAAPSILKREIEAVGSTMPSNDKRAPRRRSSIISATPPRSRCNSSISLIGPSRSIRSRPVLVCPPRRTSARSASKSSMSKA